MNSTPPATDGVQAMWWAARHPPADPTATFTGKTILITGANTGLGFEAAIKFAALDAARLMLAVRSLSRGEEARHQIHQRTGFSLDRIVLYELDMSTFASVKSFVSNLRRNEHRVDIAILNAGVAMPAYKLSPEGYEMSLQVNVLSTNLLALLLLPRLHEAAGLEHTRSQLQLVGSMGHRFVKAESLDFAINKTAPILEHFNDPKFYGAQSQYLLSKLLLMYVMDGIVSVTKPSPCMNTKSDVVITMTCPGLCQTNIGRDFSIFAKAANYTFQYVFARTAEQGARTLVSGAMLGEEAHGQFWSNDVFDRKGEMVTTEQGQRLGGKAWREIVAILRPHIPVDNGYWKQLLDESA